MCGFMMVKNVNALVYANALATSEVGIHKWKVEDVEAVSQIKEKIRLCVCSWMVSKGLGKRSARIARRRGETHVHKPKS